MKQVKQIFLFLFFALLSHAVKAQNDTESLVQNLQTSNFNNLRSFWDVQVEASMPDLVAQKQYNAKEANDLLGSFFNKNNIIGFEKNGERKVGNTIYLTGKLISSTTKYNLTLLLQESKRGVSIVSIRVN
jgi:predicted proteasome-type protease